MPCWWECQLVQPLRKRVWSSPRHNPEVKTQNKTKTCYMIQQSYFWVYMSKGNKNRVLKRCLHLHVHCGNIHSNQNLETRDLVKRWLCQQMNGQRKCMYYGYYSAMRRKGILPVGKTCMDLEGIMLSEVSQMKADKYCMISLICKI